MAVADRSIDPRILESARAEFLASGFEKASLKTICEGAGVTTGALYKRYKGKEDLFSAVVEQTVSDLYEVAHARGDKDPAVMSDQELIKAWDMDGADMMWWFRFLYDRRDDFYLLLSCSQGDPVRQLPPRLGGASDEGHQRLSGGGPAAGPVPERCGAGRTAHPAVRLLDHDLRTLHPPLYLGADRGPLPDRLRPVQLAWSAAFSEIGKASPAERFFTGQELAITNLKKRRFDCVSKSFGVCGRVSEDHLSLYGGDAHRHRHECAPLLVHLPTDPAPCCWGNRWSLDTRRGGWQPSPSAGFYTLSYM